MPMFKFRLEFANFAEAQTWNSIAVEADVQHPDF